MPLNLWLFSQQPDVTTVGVSLGLPSRVLTAVGKSLDQPYLLGNVIVRTYQWCRDGIPIPGETGLTYTETVADEGAVITCIETATNVTGGSASAVSNGIGPIPAPVGRSLAQSYLLGGTVGKSLALPYSIGTAAYTITHQWLRNGVPIPGATGGSYIPTTADIGAIISVAETLTNETGHSLTVYSAGVGPVLAEVFQETLGSQIFGNIVAPGVAFEVVADKKYASSFFAPACAVAKLTVLLDGLGSGIGNQTIRAIIYDAATGALLAVGDETVIADGAPTKWTDLLFSNYPGGVVLKAGDVQIGLIGGTNTNTVRVWGRPSVGGIVFNTDTYADGAASSFGAASTTDTLMGEFATFILPAAVPLETEFYYARFPFPLAQAALDTGKVVENSGQIASLGWHGTRIDPERGSFAVVNADGPLADLVGERLKITSSGGEARPRTVFVYCHTRASIEEDLSVTRRLFLGLSVPSDFAPSVQVEVVS